MVHRLLCTQHMPQATKMPDPRSKPGSGHLRFKSYRKTVEHPITVCKWIKTWDNIRLLDWNMMGWLKNDLWWYEFLNFINQIGRVTILNSSAADIECILTPLAVDSPGKSKRRKVSSTVKKAAHVPCAVSYKVSSTIAEYDMPVQWIYGRECIPEFVDVLKEIHRMANPILNPKAPMNPMRPAEKKSFGEKTNCYLCGQWMLGKKDLDHDRLTGEVCEN